MRRRSFLWGLILLLFLLAGIGSGIYYGYQQQNYIMSDIAQVKAPMAILTAEATGKLDWKVHGGEAVKAGEVIGSLTPIPSPSVPSPLLSGAGTSNLSGKSPPRKSNPRSAERFWKASPPPIGLQSGESLWQWWRTSQISTSSPMWMNPRLPGSRKGSKWISTLTPSPESLSREKWTESETKPEI